MQKIVPNVWCQGNAGQVGAFYASVFTDGSSQVVARYPDSGLPDFQRGLEGEPLVVDVTIGGYLVRLINAGADYRPTPALSFIVNVDPRSFGSDEKATSARLEALWAALVEDGQVRIPLGSYPFSSHYGWVEDRYGVNWQLMRTEPTGPPRAPLTPQLAFAGAQPRAKQAVDLYTGLLPEASVGVVTPRPDPPGSLLFAEFTLAGQSFSAMDAGPDHDFAFSPGVSLQVDCADQAEIDRLWTALSAVPEAERCGWLVDPFGVSWQVVPADLGQRLARPGAYERMLGMGRIVIADL
jgi:predicted 3-demethylubiquinone-9 3-methyltransferase (glyoxalase superfamily)